MTHPAIYIITLGVTIGAAFLAYLASAQHRQENPHNRSDNWSYGRPHSSWGGSKNKSGREICSICLESIEKNDGAKLPCQHEFHGKCLVELKKRYNFCPNCRQPFSVHLVAHKKVPQFMISLFCTFDSFSHLPFKIAYEMREIREISETRKS